MKPFTESMRYEYDLTPNSVVIDAGAYHGNFSKTISEKYHCHIYAFEPIKEFFEIAAGNLPPVSRIILQNYGLGAYGRTETFNVAGDCSGAFLYKVPYAQRQEQVTIQPIDIYVRGPVDLLKLNVEGMEFEILEHLTSNGMVNMIKNIQVQFHPVTPDIQPQYEALRAKLLETHQLTYDEPWVWANYQLK